MGDLKTCRHNLGWQGRDHIEVVSVEDEQLWVIKVWIQTAQALYRPTGEQKTGMFLTHRIATYF